MPITPRVILSLGGTSPAAPSERAETIQGTERLAGRRRASQEFAGARLPIAAT